MSDSGAETPQETKHSTRLSVIVVVLVTIFMLGAQLRFQQLTRPVVWNDEALTLQHVAGYGIASRTVLANRVTTAHDLTEILQSPTSGNGLKGIVSSLAYYDPNHSPLNYFFVWVWGQVYGEHTYEQLRMPEALFGTLAVPAAFWLGFELTGAMECAMLMALFVAVSPMSLHHSREIREYSLYFLMLFLTTAGFLRAYRTDKIGDWILYAALLTVGLYSHMMIALLAVSNFIYTVIDSKGKFLTGKPLRNLMFTVVASILFYPWLSVFFGNLPAAAEGSRWMSERIPFTDLLKAWIQCPVAIFVYIPTFDTGKALIYVFFAIFVACSAYVCMTQKRLAKYLVCTFVVCAGAMFAQDVIFGGKRSLYPKYVAAAPFMGLTIITVGLWQLFQSKKRQLKVAAVMVACLVFALECYLAADRIMDREPTTLGPVKLHEIADILNAQDRPLLVSMEGPQWTNFTQMLSLSHVIKPDTQIIWFDSKPALSLLPKDCTSFYLYNPPDELKQEVEKLNFQVRPTTAFALFQAVKI